jgi:hypothetical protein
MSDRLKRVLFIIGFVLFATAVGLVLWVVFFRPASGPGTNSPGGIVNEPGGFGGTLPGSGPGQGGTTVPQGGTGGIGGTGGTGGTGTGTSGGPGLPVAQTVLLRDGVTQAVSPTADGRGARYYNPDDGKFYRVAPDGVSVAMSTQSFSGVQEVVWGNSSDQAILEYPDGTKLSYDFRTQTQTTLPKHWNEFDFSPDDKSIVAESDAVSPGSRYLIITDPSGQNPRAVEPLGDNASKTFPAWTGNNQIIAYAETGSSQGFDRQEVILVGQNHENYRALQVEGRGFTPLWSPNGSRVLYSVWNAGSDYRPELWISGGDPDTINKDRAKLDLQTWADKCVWADNATVYCAVPDSIPTGAGLQRELFATLADSFYKLDMNTGTKTPLGKPEGLSGGAMNLVITSDKRHILFTDSQTGNLYDFKLP